MVRIGLIGTGWVADYHVGALCQIPDVQVAAIYDPDPTKAEQMSKRCGGKICSSTRELIRSVDVVYVLTPQDIRPGLVIEVARAGKHVFSEKPFAVTLSEADRLIEEIERAGVKAAVGHSMRYTPALHLIHDRFISGELGELVTTWSRRIWWRDVPKDHYQRSMARSGGLTTELNVHDFDFMLWTCGPVQSVYGRAIQTRSERNVEENSWSILNFKHGIGVVGTSWLSPIADTSIGIIGTRGTIVLKDNTVIEKLVDSEAEKRVEFNMDRSMEDAFLGQERDFIQFICGGRQGNATIYEARAAVEVAVAVLDSSRRNEVVHLPLQ